MGTAHLPARQCPQLAEPDTTQTSGLQPGLTRSRPQTDLQTGDGAALSNGQKAAVYYKGWLTNGQLFDQSQKGSDGNLQPFVFTLGQHQVIAGWEDALEGMKVGGVRLLIIPPSVGYGATGQGSIPPNAVLIFQVQLGAVQ